jgi:hypothetical protein
MKLQVLQKEDKFTKLPRNQNSLKWWLAVKSKFLH